MSWRATVVRSLARMLGVRSYDAAKNGGHVWGNSRPTASANVNDDLASDRPTMVSRSRHAWQNSATARAVVEGDVALVVSTGIDIEPDTGDESTNDRLRDAWNRWTEHASACGTMDLWTLQRQARRSEKTAGEWLWYLVDAEDYDKRGIPRAILPIESDRLSPTPIGGIVAGNTFVDGIEIDRYGRPVAYHISNGDASGGAIRQPHGGSMVANSGGTPVGIMPTMGGPASGGQRIPAEDIIHGFDPQRPGQVRGEPGLAPVLNTLRQELQLVEAELTAAKIGSAHAVFIASKDGGSFPADGDPNATTDSTGTTYDFSPGSVVRGEPGEEPKIIANPRPSQMIAPFRGMLRGDIAGATGLPQRYIDRDTSRANYSSMRADMLDTKRIMDPQQQRFGRQAAAEVYRRLLPQLATAAGLTMPTDPTEREAFCRCKIMPDGWAYVDPQKDIAASIDAIRAGLSTWQDETHARGKDPRLLHKQLESELSNPTLAKIFGPGAPPNPAAEAGSDAAFVSRVKAVQDAITKSGVDLPWPIVLAAGAANTAPGAFITALTKPDQTQQENGKPNQAQADSDMSPEDRARMARIERAIADISAPRQPPVTVEQRVSMDADTAAILGRAIAEHQPPAQVHVPAPVVHVAPAAVTVEAARVDVPQANVVVNVPQQPAPTVNVEPAKVVVENAITIEQKPVKATPQKDGSVLMVPQG